MIKRKILMIDDDEYILGLLQSMLESTGEFEVATESRGERGLQAAKDFMPDFIFLDIKMPIMNGFQVIAQIKGDPVTKRIPVVFLTAVLTREGPTGDPTHDDFMIGEYPYLEKPVSLEEIVECIERYSFPVRAIS